jgi:hypothetical protein
MKENGPSYLEYVKSLEQVYRSLCWKLLGDRAAFKDFFENVKKVEASDGNILLVLMNKKSFLIGFLQIAKKENFGDLNVGAYDFPGGIFGIDVFVSELNRGKKHAKTLVEAGVKYMQEEADEAGDLLLSSKIVIPFEMNAREKMIETMKGLGFESGRGVTYTRKVYQSEIKDRL